MGRSSSVLRSFALGVATLAAGSLVLSGCASNSESAGGGPTGSVSATASVGAADKDPALAALLPSKISSAGVLTVGVNVPYAPNEYLDNGKVVGFDVDLMDAVAKKLGLTTKYVQGDFDKIIPQVTGGTLDIGMSSFTDTKVRQKTVDFVDYFSAGILWAAPAGKTVDPDNACGLRVAVQSNTTESDTDLPAKSKACVKAGKAAIKVQSYESQDDATNAVVLGKADAMSADSPITAYAIKQTGGKLVQAGSIYEAAPYGWPIAKNSQLTSAIEKATQELMDNGVYLQVCQKWGVQSGAIKTAAINGGTS